MTFAIVLTFVSVFLISAGIDWVLIRHANGLGLIDIPNDRSSHVRPTPRGGGIAVVLAFFLGMGGVAWGGGLSMQVVMALLGGGLSVALIGFWDDRLRLAARWRILAHFLAAIWVLTWVGGFPPQSLGWESQKIVWFSNGLALIGLVWLVNLYNFMDGIDGIAGMEAIFVAAVASFFCVLSGDYPLATLTGIVAASVAGFQIWNLPPARIFLGDVGSGFLGLILGALAVISISNGSTQFWSWVILLGVFVADTLVTLIRRVVRGERWYEAHCSHAYQHLARRVKSHGKVTVAVGLINLFWLLPLAYAAWRWPNFAVPFTVVALIPLIFLAICLNAGKDFLQPYQKS